MDAFRKVDVIVPLAHDGVVAPNGLAAVLERSGPVLNRLIVVDDRGAESEIARDLERLAERDGRVVILSHDQPVGAVASCNHGLSHRQGDAVLLAPDRVVVDGWLVELAAVAHSEARTACASPLTNVGGLCSVPELNRYCAAALSDEEVRASCAGLPRWTVAPLLSASCIYLRGDVLDAVGPLDSRPASAPDAVHHWVARAQALGFVAKRANRVHVPGSSPEEVPAATVAAAGGAAPEEAHVKHQFERFCRTAEGRVAAHAVAMRATGKVRVAYDIRHLPYEEVGTRTYAVSLAQALAGLPGVELTLLVREPAQARGLTGRIVTEDRWPDDVAVIHRPAQVFHPRELGLLLGSSAHLLITYQDLICYRIPQIFADPADFDGYRATSRMTLQAAQRVLAYSEDAADEIAGEFGIPRDEIVVTPLGVEAGRLSRREEGDDAIREGLNLPPRYFLSLATDFPHKNLPNLLDAYASLRGRWRGDGEAPGLVLAGHAAAGRAGFYHRLTSGPPGAGLTFLGAVTRDQLRVLYRDAVALVFPSLYEGFGLPPLEAMAAGTPVIAMPISSVPEVAGDGAFYPAGLSSDALARAMESVACDADLRGELRERGLRRVEKFRWETTARATLDAYRSAILNPSPRSLLMRRQIEDMLAYSVEPVAPASRVLAPSDPPPLEPMGIRNAWNALHFALHRRLGREMGRFGRPGGRKSA